MFSDGKRMSVTREVNTKSKTPTIVDYIFPHAQVNTLPGYKLTTSNSHPCHNSNQVVKAPIYVFYISCNISLLEGIELPFNIWKETSLWSQVIGLIKHVHSCCPISLFIINLVQCMYNLSNVTCES
jgi:hypothetical protein